jgi:hypothetical protein
LCVVCSSHSFSEPSRMCLVFCWFNDKRLKGLESFDSCDCCDCCSQPPAYGRKTREMWGEFMGSVTRDSISWLDCRVFWLSLKRTQRKMTSSLNLPRIPPRDKNRDRPCHILSQPPFLMMVEQAVSTGWTLYVTLYGFSVNLMASSSSLLWNPSFDLEENNKVMEIQ